MIPISFLLPKVVGGLMRLDHCVAQDRLRSSDPTRLVGAEDSLCLLRLNIKLLAPGSKARSP